MIFENLNTRTDACASDLDLDELAADLVEPSRATTLRAHIATCSRCQERSAAIATDRAQFASSHAAAFVPGERAQDRIIARSSRAWLVSSGVSALAAAAAILVVVVRTPDDDVRLKGGPALSFHVKRGDKETLGAPGMVLHPGDQLRFVVDLPTASYVAVLSRDGKGTVSAYFPTEDRAMRIEAGTAVALPIATELDDVVGDETLYGFFCESAVPIADLIAMKPIAACSTRTIVVKKEPAP